MADAVPALPDKLEEWVGKGLITQAQAGAIAAHESTVRAAPPTSNTPRGVLPNQGWRAEIFVLGVGAFVGFLAAFAMVAAGGNDLIGLLVPAAIFVALGVVLYLSIPATRLFADVALVAGAFCVMGSTVGLERDVAILSFPIIIAVGAVVFVLRADRLAVMMTDLVAVLLIAWTANAANVEDKINDILFTLVGLLAIGMAILAQPRLRGLAVRLRRQS